MSRAPAFQYNPPVRSARTLLAAACLVLWAAQAEARFSAHRFPSTQSTAFVHDSEPSPELQELEGTRGWSNVTRLTQRVGLFWTDPDTHDQISLLLGYARLVRSPQDETLLFTERSDDAYSAGLTLPLGRGLNLSARDDYREVRYPSVRVIQTDAGYKRNTIGPELSYDLTDRVKASAGYTYTARRARKEDFRFLDYATHGGAFGLEWRQSERTTWRLTYTPTLRDFTTAPTSLTGELRGDIFHPVSLEHQRRFGIATQVVNSVEYRANTSNEPLIDFWQIRGRSAWVVNLTPNMAFYLEGAYAYRHYDQFLLGFVAPQVEPDSSGGADSGGGAASPALDDGAPISAPFRGGAPATPPNLFARNDHRLYGNVGLSITFLGRITLSATYGRFHVTQMFPGVDDRFIYWVDRVNLGLAAKI